MCNGTIAHTLRAGITKAEQASTIDMARFVATGASPIVGVGGGADVAMLRTYYVRKHG